MIRRDIDSNFTFSFSDWKTVEAFGSVASYGGASFEAVHGHYNAATLMAAYLDKYYNVRLDRPAKVYCVILQTTSTDYWLAMFKEGRAYNTITVLEINKLAYSEASKVMFDLIIKEQRHALERGFGMQPGLRPSHLARNKFREACLPFVVSGACAGGIKFGDAVARRYFRRLATVLHGSSHYLTALDDLLDDVDRLRRAKRITA
ncbi:hypothetical protein G6M20_25100 [Agrobacterium salinitolerans]|nr:hypothetical protein [Agrobacterium salinitolerans]